MLVLVSEAVSRSGQPHKQNTSSRTQPTFVVRKRNGEVVATLSTGQNPSLRVPPIQAVSAKPPWRHTCRMLARPEMSEGFWVVAKEPGDWFSGFVTREHTGMQSSYIPTPGVARNQLP